MVPVWPPPPPFDDAIRGAVGMAYKVSASYNGSPVAGAQDLRPVGGSITDTNRPGVRRVLSLDLAGDHVLFDSLAPTGTELAVTCTVIYTDRTSVTIPMGVFDVDKDSIDEGSGRIGVTAPDKWARIQRAKFLRPTSSTIGQSVVAQITDLIRGALGASTPVTVTASSAATVGALTWEKDRDKAILDLAEQIGAWVYFDRFGEATIADIPQAGATARTWLVDASATGVLTELSREWSRTDTYNVVVVESSSAAAEKFPTQLVWDDNPASPTYAGTDPVGNPGSAGPFGIVVAYLDSPNLASAAEAQAAGLSYLARGAGLVSQVSLGQVPNPAVDAFDTIDVIPPGRITSITGYYGGTGGFGVSPFGVSPFGGVDGVPILGFTPTRVVERHVVDTVTHPLTLGTAQQIDGRQTRADL